MGCLGIFIESKVAAVDVKLFQSYSDRRFRVNEVLYGIILSTIYTLYLTSEINVNLLTILLFYAPINKLFSAIMQQFVIFVISITHNATKYCSNIASRSERYTIIVGWKPFENIVVFFSKKIKIDNEYSDRIIS